MSAQTPAPKPAFFRLVSGEVGRHERLPILFLAGLEIQAIDFRGKLAQVIEVDALAAGTPAITIINAHKISIACSRVKTGGIQWMHCKRMSVFRAAWNAIAPCPALIVTTQEVSSLYRQSLEDSSAAKCMVRVE